MARPEQDLVRVLSPVCTSLEVVLDDVELSAGTLRVTIERDGGLDLDALAVVARKISELLDEDESLAPDEPYELEVTTPGVERRLRRPEQFQRALGSRIALRLRAGVEGERRLEGMLERADDEAIEVRVEETSRRVAYGDIDRAHTVFDWRASFAKDNDARHSRDETRKKVASS